MTLPSGVSLTGTATCTSVSSGAPIDASLGAGSYSVEPSSCRGLSLAGQNAAAYSMRLIGATFTVRQAQVQVLVYGNQTYGSPTPGFNAIPASHYLPSGVLPVSGTDHCSTVNSGTPITNSLPVGTYTVDAGSCSGPSLAGPNAANYTLALVGGTFAVLAAEVQVTVSGSENGPVTFTAVPTVAPLPSGVTLSGTATCTSVGSGTPINGLFFGTYTIDAGSCSGLSLSGPNAPDYVLSLVGGPFAVIGIQIDPGRPTGPRP